MLKWFIIIYKSHVIVILIAFNLWVNVLLKIILLLMMFNKNLYYLNWNKTFIRTNKTLRYGLFSDLPN